MPDLKNDSRRFLFNCNRTAMMILMAARKPIDRAPYQLAAGSSSTTNTYLAHKAWLLAFALVIVTFVVYQPTWHAGFIWDDDDHVTANPAMTAPNGLRMIWSSLAVSRYYPLTLTTFWIEHHLWGLSPTPYHLVNVTLHAINGVLLFLVLRRLRVSLAWLAAAVWVLHPVNVESVAWITELKNIQSGFFFFAALLCFLRFEAEGQRRWYALALLCGACAFLSKASTVILPLALLLCVWWETGAWRKRDFVRTAPFFVLAVLMSVLTIVEQRGHVARQGTSEWSISVTQRAVIAGKSIGFYVGKIFWPADLAFVYRRWEVANSLSSCLPSVAVVAIGSALWAWRRRPWARAGLFGFGFFLAALLPALGFFDVYYFRYSFVADHFQYLASVGIIACATCGISYILDRTGFSSALAGNAVCLMLLAPLAGLTWKQSHIYHDSETLWQDTVTKNPGAWIAQNNLGVVLVQLGRASEAIGHYDQALRLKPDFAEAYDNRGVALAQLDKTEEAIGQYEQALQLDPHFSEAHYNLGIALSQTGRLLEAVEHYERALQAKPDYPKAHNNLGVVLAQTGQTEQAIQHYEEALRLEPDYFEAHNNLGVALVQLNRIPEAIAHYEQALRINPGFADAHVNFAVALEQVNRAPEAIEHYQQALRLKPDFVEARSALARLHAVP
jgi:tetratricopeptide (TPR) repeat protein